MEKELVDMNAIKANKDKFFDSLDEYFVKFVGYVKNLSQQTLHITAIAILHATFIPSTLAYLNALTERTPNIDSVLIVTIALSVMALSAMIRRDMMSIFVHMIGFITNCVLLSLIVFK